MRSGFATFQLHEKGFLGHCQGRARRADVIPTARALHRVSSALFTASDDKTARLWVFDTQKIDDACEDRCPRCLTGARSDLSCLLDNAWREGCARLDAATRQVFDLQRVFD